MLLKLQNFVSSHLFTASSSTFGLKVFSQLLALLFTVILARQMNLEDFGLYLLVMGWVGTLYIVARFGMDQSTNRFIPDYVVNKKWKLLAGYKRFSSIVTIGVSGVLTLLAILFSLWYAKAYDATLFLDFAVGFLIVPFWSLLELEQAKLRAIHKTVLSMVADHCCRPVLQLAGIITLILWGIEFTPKAILIINLIAYVIAFSLAWALRLRGFQFYEKPKTFETRTNEWLKTGFLLMFVASTLVLMRQTDILMLGFLSTLDNVGLYGPAMKIATLSTFVITSVSLVISPLIAEHFSKNQHEKLQSIITQSSWMILIGSIGLVSFLALFSEHILGLFGPDFIDSQMALIILLSSILTLTLFGPVHFIMTMTNSQLQAAIIISISLVINVGLNVMLIPLYGIDGAAFATGSSLVLQNFMMLLYILKNTQINPSVFRFKKVF